jgi:hypothetical protein
MEDAAVGVVPHCNTTDDTFPRHGDELAVVDAVVLLVFLKIVLLVDLLDNFIDVNVSHVRNKPHHGVRGHGVRVL